MNNFAFLSQPWPYLAVAGLAAAIGWYVWKQPRRPGTRTFTWIVSVWLVWALAAALQLVFRSSALSYALWVLQIFCAMLEAPLELLFSLEYTGSEQWLKRRWMPLLFLPALAIVVLAVLLPGATVGAERLWGLELFQGRELLKWGYFLYTVILILVNLGVLLACLLRARAFWAPILLVCLGRVIPAVAFVLLDAQELPVAPIQVTILFAAPSMLAYFVALYSYGLLRVMPVARDLVISRMPYALIVLDAENRLVDFNLAAQALPGLPPLPGRPGDLLLRLDAQRALGGWWDRISPLVGSQPAAQDVTVYNEGGEQIYRVLSQPLLHASGWRMGQVLLFEDVTQARLAQSQQAQMLWARAALEERSQLATELHDGISQSLAFLSLQSQSAQVYLERGQIRAAQDSLARLNEATGEIQTDTRELIGSLLSVKLPGVDFCDSLRQVVAGFEHSTGLPVRLEMDQLPPQRLQERLQAHANSEPPCDPYGLPPPVAVQLIRITQEALANVRKHASGASQVSVLLQDCGSEISLTIADDGAGFDPADLKNDGKHFGLLVMQQRAARIGGQVLVESADGVGTRLQVHLPVAALQADEAARSRA